MKKVRVFKDAKVGDSVWFEFVGWTSIIKIKKNKEYCIVCPDSYTFNSFGEYVTRHGQELFYDEIKRGVVKNG